MTLKSNQCINFICSVSDFECYTKYNVNAVIIFTEIHIGPPTGKTRNVDTFQHWNQQLFNGHSL